MGGKRDRRVRQVQREEAKLPSFTARRYFVLTVFVLAATALVWRAVDQQILEKVNNLASSVDGYIQQAELPEILGDSEIVKRIWEETDGLGYTYIWQCLLSF